MPVMPNTLADNAQLLSLENILPVPSAACDKFTLIHEETLTEKDPVWVNTLSLLESVITIPNTLAGRHNDSKNMKLINYIFMLYAPYIVLIFSVAAELALPC